MLKYLILYVFSFASFAMDESAGKSPRNLMPAEVFKEFLNKCKESLLSKEQCRELEETINSPNQAAAPKRNLTEAFGRSHKPQKAKKQKIELSDENNIPIVAKKELPEGLKIYTIMESVVLPAETKNTGVFYVSPSKPKNAIYGHFAVNTYWDNYIDKSDRIDVSKILKEKAIKAAQLSKDKYLFTVLLEVELKLRKIFSNEAILRSIIYAGLAEDFRHRGYGHGSDIAHSEDKKLASKKLFVETQILRDGANIRMSYLVEKIPKARLKDLETLMANLTLIFDFGASAEIGDEASAKKIKEYKKWKERVDRLKKEGFNYEIEALRKSIREKIHGLKIEPKNEESSDAESEEADPISGDSCDEFSDDDDGVKTCSSEDELLA